MKLISIGFEAKSKGLYLVFLEYGGRRFIEEIRVREGVVLYVEYGFGLQKVLHRNARDVKNMHRLMFEIYRGEYVGFPVCIGEF